MATLMREHTGNNTVIRCSRSRTLCLLLTGHLVTTMQNINGTKGVVYIGQVVETPGTYGPDGHEITPPVYYPGVAYDIMSTDVIDFGANEVYPGDAAAHSFFGWPRGAEVPPVVNSEEEE